MGLLPCPCPLPCNDDKIKERQEKSIHLHFDSSSSFLSSQPSLPSVPSLSSPSQHRQPPENSVFYECMATLKGHSSYVSSLSLAGSLLFTGSSDSEIRVWRREPPYKPESSGENIVAFGNGAVKALVVLRDKLIISAHQDQKIRVWKIKAKDNLQRNYKCIATLPTMNDRFTRFFSAKNYVEVRRHKKSTWVHHVDAVSALALSKDGYLLYSASWDRTFKIWRTSDFRCLESKERAHDDAINAIIVSHDGFVYTGSADKRIKVWKKLEAAGDKKHSLVGTLEKHLSAVNALAVSEDGAVLYSGACDKSILVWERNPAGSSGHMSLIGALRGHTKAILCLAVVSDLVFSGSADNTVRIWRRGMEKTYSCLAVLEGHSKPVKCLAASLYDSDGNVSCVVYSGSLDFNVKIWKISIPLLS